MPTKARRRASMSPSNARGSETEDGTPQVVRHPRRATIAAHGIENLLELFRRCAGQLRHQQWSGLGQLFFDTVQDVISPVEEGQVDPRAQPLRFLADS